MVTLDDSDRAGGTEHAAEHGQGLQRPREVLEHEAHEDVVERPRLEGQVEDVRLPELHVGETRRVGAALGRGE